MSQATDCVTRFAPSPTGHLHIGGARTALFCWALARGAGGRFVLRVEDTDQARSSEASERAILDDLAWLGLDWDDGPLHSVEDEAGARQIGGDDRGVGPFRQSQRLDLYNTAMDALLSKGRAYHAFESPEELEQKRKAALAAKQQYRYDRAALEIPEAERFERAAAGEPHVVRFRTPDEPITVRDAVLGEITVQPSELDDFIVRKRDGFPTYHFAVVVDDEAMGVTHVVRGQEHLANTPRHVALQMALGYRIPIYAHLPLIFNADGSKMSKRDKDKAARQACKQAGVDSSPVTAIGADEYAAWLKDSKSQLDLTQLAALAEAVRFDLPEINVDDFRAAGYLPEVVCNYIALLGFSPGDDLEKFDNAFLTQRFALDRVGKANAKFDRKKLLAFNTDALAEMSDEAFAKRWRHWCAREAPQVVDGLDESQFRLMAEAVRPRSKTFRDAADSAGFALMSASDIVYDEKAVAKNLSKNDGEGFDVLARTREALSGLDTFDPATVQRAVEQVAESGELKLGKVAQPLRVALTGSTVSPPIDATLTILGRDETLRRIDGCLALRASTTADSA